MQRVCHLSFSPDVRFLLGCGGDGLVYVWDTSTGELVTGKQYAEPSTLGEWTAVKLTGRRPVYEVGRLAVGWGSVLVRAEGIMGAKIKALEPQTPILMIVTSYASKLKFIHGYCVEISLGRRAEIVLKSTSGVTEKTRTK